MLEVAISHMPELNSLEPWLTPFGAHLDQLKAILFAWARVMPSLVLLPVFALRGAPTSIRALLGVALACVIAPAIAEPKLLEGDWVLGMFEQFLAGLPVAVAAALGLWVFLMLGGLLDDLNGLRAELSSPLFERPVGPLGVLFGLLACLIFLESGGVARLGYALIEYPEGYHMGALRVTEHLLSGIYIAFAVAAPLLAASLVLQVAASVVIRAANPAHLQPVVEPLKNLGLLVILALILDRILVAGMGAFR